MIKPILHKLIAGEDLIAGEASAIMSAIATGSMTDAQIGCFLTAMRMKGVTTPELTAFAQVLQEHAIPVIPEKEEILVDTCGTGGDGANTFNISTAAAIVTAAAGVRVVKHGNRSVSSSCGSADVLEALGVPIELNCEEAARSVTSSGIAFLYAPRFHPAMGRVAPARKETGFFSVFNILGPLLNPARAQARLIGVGDEKLLKTVPETLKSLGIPRAMVVHGNGTDEITVCGPTEIAELDHGTIRRFRIVPEDFGIQRACPSDLTGGNAAVNAEIIHQILAGMTGPKRDVVVLNAAAAIMLGGGAESLREGIVAAKEAIDSGRAKKTLEHLTMVCGE